MLPVSADTAAVQQLSEEKKGFRVSDTGVLEELGERFGQSLHMRRRRPDVVHAVYLMKGMSVAHENRRDMPNKNLAHLQKWPAKLICASTSPAHLRREVSAN